MGARMLKNVFRPRDLAGGVAVNGKQYSALFDSAFVPLCFILRNAHPNQGAYHAADRSAGAKSGCSFRAASK